MAIDLNRIEFKVSAYLGSKHAVCSTIRKVSNWIKMLNSHWIVDSLYNSFDCCCCGSSGAGGAKEFYFS